MGCHHSKVKYTDAPHNSDPAPWERYPTRRPSVDSVVRLERVDVQTVEFPQPEIVNRVKKVEIKEIEKPEKEESLEELTPLIFTRIQHGDMKSVHRFLLLEGDVNHHDKDKNSLLNIACRYGQKDIAQFLLGRKSIDVNAQAIDGSTPLIRASYYGYAFITDLLLQNPDIDVNHKDNEGNTALHVAIAYQRNHIVEKLLANPKIDLSVRKNTNTYAIHACIHHNFGALKLLLPRKDVEIHSANRNGKTALKILHEHRAMKELAGEDIRVYKEMEELLMKHDETAPSPETPAHKRKILEKLAKKNERYATSSEQRKKAMEEKKKAAAQKSKEHKAKPLANKSNAKTKTNKPKEGVPDRIKEKKAPQDSEEHLSVVSDIHIDTGKSDYNSSTVAYEHHKLEKRGSVEHVEELKKVLNERVKSTDSVETMTIHRVIQRSGQREGEDAAPIVAVPSQQQLSQEKTAHVLVHTVPAQQQDINSQVKSIVGGASITKQEHGDTVVIHAEPIRVTRIAYRQQAQEARDATLPGERIIPDNASEIESVYSCNQIAEPRRVVAKAVVTAPQPAPVIEKIVTVEEQVPVQEEILIEDTLIAAAKEEKQVEKDVLVVEEVIETRENPNEQTIVLTEHSGGPAQPKLIPLSKYHVYKSIHASPKKMRVVRKHHKVEREAGREMAQDV